MPACIKMTLSLLRTSVATGSSRRAPLLRARSKPAACRAIGEGQVIPHRHRAHAPIRAHLCDAGPLRRSYIALLTFGLLIALGLVLSAITGIADGLDHRLIESAVRHRTMGLTTVARALSVLGRSWVLIPLTLIVGLAMRRRLGWRAFGPLIAVLGAQQLQNIIKLLVDRPRPTVLHLVHATGSSFPSGHASESAAAGIALILLTRGARRYQLLMVTVIVTVLVVMISASRVYLGVHYPTDVVVGMALGSAWGVTASWWCTNDGRDPPTYAVSRGGLGSPARPAKPPGMVGTSW
jgi:undecaprenyl-diphosphatase